jgi:hypothetical protein
MSDLSQALGANRVIRIRLEHKRYAHWSARSGYTQFVRYLDPQRFRTVLHGVSESDADLAWPEPLQRLLRKVIRRSRMPWYSLSDLNAELLALVSCVEAKPTLFTFSMASVRPYFCRGFSGLRTFPRSRPSSRFISHLKSCTRPWTGICCRGLIKLS